MKPTTPTDLNNKALPEPQPCPFCGSSDLGIERRGEDFEGYPTSVYCDHCGARGPWIYTRTKAIWTCISLACEETGWNTRPDHA